MCRDWLHGHGENFSIGIGTKDGDVVVLNSNT